MCAWLLGAIRLAGWKSWLARILRFGVTPLFRAYTLGSQHVLVSSRGTYQHGRNVRAAVQTVLGITPLQRNYTKVGRR
jgi:hypothetical protein